MNTATTLEAVRFKHVQGHDLLREEVDLLFTEFDSTYDALHTLTQERFTWLADHQKRLGLLEEQVREVTDDTPREKPSVSPDQGAPRVL